MCLYDLPYQLSFELKNIYLINYVKVDTYVSMYYISQYNTKI